MNKQLNKVADDSQHSTKDFDSTFGVPGEGPEATPPAAVGGAASAPPLGTARQLEEEPAAKGRARDAGAWRPCYRHNHRLGQQSAIVFFRHLCGRILRNKVIRSLPESARRARRPCLEPLDAGLAKKSESTTQETLARAP